MLKKCELVELYERVKHMPRDTIKTTLKIRQDEASVLVPTLITYIKLMEFVGTDTVKFSHMTFPHMLSLFHSNTVRDRGFIARVRKTLYGLGERFNIDRKHADLIASFALKLFDALKPLHAMTRRERFILEAAAILCDSGYYIDTKKHNQHSYYLVQSIEIPGLPRDTVKLISYLALMHNGDVQEWFDNKYTYFPMEKQLLIKKMVSLLRIADSLDSSHMALIQDFDVDILQGKIVIRAKCKKIAFLEKQSFEVKSKVFTETFGIPIELETRILYE